LWIKKHQAKVLENTRHLLQAKDFINLRLTGSLASDASSNRGIVDFSTNRPAEKLLAALALPDLLPPLHAPEGIIGEVTPSAAEVTGLRAGMPVVAGWNDLNASVLGSGIVHVAEAFDVTGTSEHIGVVTAGTHSSSELMCAPYLPGKRLLYGVTSSGGGSLDWFSHFSGRDLQELMTSASEAESRILFLPYLEGERSPIWDPHASGTFVGLRSTHGAAHAARAVLEGVAFSLRHNLEAVERVISGRPDTIVISGGGSRIDLWNQIKADVLSCEVATLDNYHAGILGAAILASAGVKLFPDLESASVAMTRIRRRFQPEQEQSARLDRLYEIYRGLYPAMKETFKHLDAEDLLTSRRLSQ
jgi:sugar (pentulose or hexulose) kinase